VAHVDSSSAPPVTARVLLALAWPIVLARATQAVVGFTDALMVAPLGEDTLAAVTTGALDTFAFVMLPMGTVFIVQSFAAQLHGRGELHAVRRYAFYGLAIALASGLLSAAAIPFMDELLAPLGYAPAVHAQMSEYIAIRLLSVAAVVGVETIGNWYGGLGNTRLAMVVGIVAMFANVAGNYALIEPRFGLPGYGAAGAAWASTLATWLGFGVAAGAFTLGIGCRQARVSGPLGLRRVELLRVLRFGLPNGVNWFLEFAAFALFINVVVGHLGTSTLAAMNVVLQINSISFMPAFGVASAGAILVGTAIGAGRHDQVWPIVRMTLAVTCTWMVSVGVVYWLAPSQLIGLFRPRDVPAENLIAIGAMMLALSALWQLFDAMAMSLSEALRAAGDTTWCMNARIVLAWFVFTPGAWFAVLVLDGGVPAIMASVIGYIALLALALAFRFATGRWRQIDLLGSELPQV
jgi:MATE family multidrug resistance protein